MPFFHKNVSQEEVPNHFAILLRGLQLKKTFQVQVFRTEQREKKVARDTIQNCKKTSIPIIFRNKCSMVFGGGGVTVKNKSNIFRPIFY
jgi:hypothetical protein